MDLPPPLPLLEKNRNLEHPNTQVLTLKPLNVGEFIHAKKNTSNPLMHKARLSVQGLSTSAEKLISFLKDIFISTHMTINAILMTMLTLKKTALRPIKNRAFIQGQRFHSLLMELILPPARLMIRILTYKCLSAGAFIQQKKSVSKF